MEAKTSEWRPGPSVCRCCLTEGCYKDISTEYFWMGKREVYSEMLSETFNVSISYSQSGGPNSNSRLICEPCISRLRDASEFKRQVVECEKTFIHHLDPTSSVLETEVPVVPDELETDVKIERVKLEDKLSDDDFGDRDFAELNNDDDDDDDLDDQPLMTLATKVPKKESVDLLDLLDNKQATVKRKSTSKAKGAPAKKTKVVKRETAKASASKVKVAPKQEKKKKETDPDIMAKRNAEVVLQHTTVCPFRLRGKDLVCVYCCDQFEDPDLFRQHVSENHKKFTISTAFFHIGRGKDYLKVDCTDLKCRICFKSFDVLQDAAQHILEAHESKAAKMLNLNYSIGMQPYRLIKDKWQCYICNKKFPSLVKLGRHTPSHYLQYTCDICGRCYLKHEALKYHIRCSHTGNHVCRKCWKDFPTEEERREHLRTSKKCWTFACIYCGDRFQSWENKQKHLMEHHGVAKPSYPCPDCDMTFQSRKRFYAHHKTTHSDDNFICSCCGLKFGSKNQLEDHRLGHTGEKTFKCSVCSKAFTRKKSLVQHMWIHSDSKRFVCVICSKQFAQKVSFTGHMKSHHPEAVL